MNSFLVSARKYRPQKFTDVVGQSSITTTLKNAIQSDHLAQSFLFCGPRGVGKTTCARIMAKTINCETPLENGEACDTCDSCQRFNENTSFNIYELDAASNNSVDDIRSLVDQVRIPPQDGKYKVYIIDEVHMLSSAAFNAFLKTLEEPPAYAKFILATTEKHKIIPTILSRCQIFDFKRITVKDIVEHLKQISEAENVNPEEDGLQIIALKADGALRDALTIFDQMISFSGTAFTYQDVIDNLNVLSYEYYFSFVEYFLANDTKNCLLTFNKIISSGYEGQHFITGLSNHIRDLLVSKDPETVSLLEVSQNIQEKYSEQAQKCTSDFLINCLDILNEADLQYKVSNNKNLHIEITLLQLASITANSDANKKKSS